MQAIVVFAVMVIAATGLSVGFLSNTINLTVQNLGVGEQDLTSPITNATIDLNVNQTLVDPDTIPDSGDEFFANTIDECSFHSQENIVGNNTIICKLTDINGTAIAEGSIDLSGYTASTTEFIPIDSTAFTDANDVRNIHDVTIVVVGEDPTP